MPSMQCGYCADKLNHMTTCIQTKIYLRKNVPYHFCFIFLNMFAIRLHPHLGFQTRYLRPRLLNVRQRFKGGQYGVFIVLYSTLLHLPPLIFLCVGGCWEWTQARADPLNNSARSHPLTRKMCLRVQFIRMYIVVCYLVVFCPLLEVPHLGLELPGGPVQVLVLLLQGARPHHLRAAPPASKNKYLKGPSGQIRGRYQSIGLSTDISYYRFLIYKFWSWIFKWCSKF